MGVPCLFFPLNTVPLRCDHLLSPPCPSLTSNSLLHLRLTLGSSFFLTPSGFKNPFSAASSHHSCPGSSGEESRARISQDRIMEPRHSRPRILEICHMMHAVLLCGVSPTSQYTRRLFILFSISRQTLRNITRFPLLSMIFLILLIEVKSSLLTHFRTTLLYKYISTATPTNTQEMFSHNLPLGVCSCHIGESGFASPGQRVTRTSLNVKMQGLFSTVPGC
jgi:hypothetical protein